MTDILAQVKQAKAAMDADRDELLLALASLAAHRQISIIPRQDELVSMSRPILILPQTLYDRMMEIIPRMEEG